jgi:CrcB protein
MTLYRFHVYLLIALGGAIGSLARYACAGLMARLLGETFPWGTLAVNLFGSIFIGFFATLTAPEGRLLVPGPTRLFVMVGLCGGFTTFSTFSLETLSLARDGQLLKAGLNVVSNLVLCLLGVWNGFLLASLLNER